MIKLAEKAFLNAANGARKAAAKQAIDNFGKKPIS